MSLTERAQSFAITAHRKKDHRRKYSGEPYEVHLFDVADRVVSVTHDERTIAAAWLHDVVEDTDVTLAEIQAEFGSEAPSWLKT
ncbi:MAG TPA: HD domain-containing protein [Oligoflexus sp.]|uniref:HD domain-containing protein n=1 Tax=Oligoflexus sp. TaxID=1971216 RepID=UPI002D3BC32C|nr:HD domain-containing protein [Oligoflexus sp.]HYX31466.1 HD domain-containing protein [Oligoflexus sp.]